MSYSALENLLCLVAQSSRESPRPSKWIIEKGTFLRALEINRALQSEENFIECYRSAKKRIESMESYSGLRYYLAQVSVMS